MLFVHITVPEQNKATIRLQRRWYVNSLCQKIEQIGDSEITKDERGRVLVKVKISRTGKLLSATESGNPKLVSVVRGLLPMVFPFNPPPLGYRTAKFWVTFNL